MVTCTTMGVFTFDGVDVAALAERIDGGIDSAEAC